MGTPDETLLAQVGAGDVTAFGELYDRYSGRVLGFVTKMLGRRDDAEDVLQDAFWQVWCTASGYDASRASPAAWLFMIARSRACDALRRTAARKVEVERSGSCRSATGARRLARARTR